MWLKMCLNRYMVDSHESDAFGPYFEKVNFLNIQNIAFVNFNFF